MSDLEPVLVHADKLDGLIAPGSLFHDGALVLCKQAYATSRGPLVWMPGPGAVPRNLTCCSIDLRNPHARDHALRALHRTVEPEMPEPFSVSFAWWQEEDGGWYYVVGEIGSTHRCDALAVLAQEDEGLERDLRALQIVIQEVAR
jgi:hypothetical protein